MLRIKPDIVGFSVLTNQYKYSFEIARDIKKYLDVRIIFMVSTQQWILKEPLLSQAC